jgi:hypothetical protein
MTAMANDRADRVRLAITALLPTLGHIDAVERVEVGWGNENWTAETSLGRVMVKVGLSGADPEKWRCA